MPALGTKTDCEQYTGCSHMCAGLQSSSLCDTVGARRLGQDLLRGSWQHHAMARADCFFMLGQGEGIFDRSLRRLWAGMHISRPGKRARLADRRRFDWRCGRARRAERDDGSCACFTSPGQRVPGARAVAYSGLCTCRQTDGLGKTWRYKAAAAVHGPSARSEYPFGGYLHVLRE